jgi:hypothetical protein
MPSHPCSMLGLTPPSLSLSPARAQPRPANTFTPLRCRRGTIPCPSRIRAPTSSRPTDDLRTLGREHGNRSQPVADRIARSRRAYRMCVCLRTCKTLSCTLRDRSLGFYSVPGQRIIISGMDGRPLLIVLQDFFWHELGSFGSQGSAQDLWRFSVFGRAPRVPRNAQPRGP